MGALHEGHLSLMRKAKSLCDEVVVSIFVNPLQFGPNEDYARYPRREAEDAALADSVGVDALFIPSAEEFLGAPVTQVHVAGVTELYEGARRPGHFDGVATIVAKLFNAVNPRHAFFGLKDRQQCAVVAAMVRDLNYKIELHNVPTVRESDGLALSSRNAYLSPKEREIAPLLHKTLRQAASEIAAGKFDSTLVLKAVSSAASALAEAGFEVDYLDLVDAHRFQPVRQASSDAVVVAAAKLGRTRLIDNVDI
jgi:pantoate--beta-alanine ligase